PGRLRRALPSIAMESIAWGTPLPLFVLRAVGDDGRISSAASLARAGPHPSASTVPRDHNVAEIVSDLARVEPVCCRGRTWQAIPCSARATWDSLPHLPHP